MTDATDLRGLTELEAARTELVVLRFIRKALADGDVQLAGDLAIQFDKLLAASLRATTLYVNGIVDERVPLAVQ